MHLYRALRTAQRFSGKLSEAVRVTGSPAVSDSQAKKSPIASSKALSEKMVINTDEHARLVIFDKDGTLISFDALWMPWAETIVSQLASLTALRNIERKAKNVLGICSKTQKILPGLLAEGTHQQIKRALCHLLEAEGIKPETAVSVVDEVFKHPPSTDKENLKPLHDLKVLFSTLKQYGVKTAICTSDSRANTIRSLVEMELVSLVDKVVCGDDVYGKPKPAAHNAKIICEQLSVRPEETVMVGDTKTDMEFAKNAKLSKAVGVLSGVGRQADLDEGGADVVIASVENILPLVLPSRSIRLTPIARHLSEKQWKLIVMDKDGTLSDTRSKWLAWTLQIGKRLREQVGVDSEEAFYEVVGLDRSHYSLLGTRVLSASVVELHQTIRHLLLMQGVHPQELDSVMDRVWEDGSQFSEQPLPGVVETLQFFRARGVKLGLLTADVRSTTTNFIQQLHSEPLFDCVITAEDTPQALKPLPQGLLTICEQLEVDPLDTLMVGDSRGDLYCGLAARVGATIGVLSGISGAEALMSSADALIPNITYLSRLLRLKTSS